MKQHRVRQKQAGANGKSPAQSKQARKSTLQSVVSGTLNVPKNSGALVLPERRFADLSAYGLACLVDWSPDDARGELECLWQEHAQVIHDVVWRPLVQVSPRAALEIAQAAALAELSMQTLGGCMTEYEMVGPGPDGETTAAFYARWNAELLADDWAGYLLTGQALTKGGAR